MKKNKTGLKSNLQKVDNHEISTGDYADIPELPEDFFVKGQLYQNGKPLERRTRGKQKNPTKKQLTIRLNNEVIDFFKNQGNGWQTRINDILQKYVDSHHIA
ncbi:MAG: BrnA antitoxin family protein [Deltaproteobacteria bacterium]|jgi:uncharacterized protein (DUF4415 family)|nr:BrnA antitoxin family protein [Deltaproteobacteria bacterium]MBT4525279.1 BrnA antitoxin family protein [Deltaproteobacteria bacterium]